MKRFQGRMLIIGDVHAPFHDKEWLKWVYGKVADLKPTHVVQIGDLLDLYNFSRYSREASWITPEDELGQGMSAAGAMWKAVRTRAPKAKLWQLAGNHDPMGRILKRIRESLPEIESLVDLQRLLTFPGVETLHDPSEELLIDDICLMHGHKGLGQHGASNQMNTVVGHLHRLDVKWFMNKRGPFYELNVGCGVDRKSKAFAYRAQKKLCNWNLGLGFIDSDGPRAIPYIKEAV